MRLLGALDETDVRAELDASDVYLGSSRTEGMSNSIMEAISRHLPTIATDVGGTHELVGTAGVLVEAGRPDLLAAEIVRVTGDAELVERLRAASALRATGFRTPNDTALEHVRLYQRYRRYERH
jgi:glycosyltransferase involved in cell wall biosynthesis